MALKEEILHQEPNDRLVLVTQGKYSGHEGIIRKLESGEMAVLILEKNHKNQGPVRVIDIVKLNDTGTLDPNIH